MTATLRPLGEEFQINSFVDGSQTRVQVAGLSDGYVVIWVSDGQDGDGYGLFGQRYDTDGVATGAEFQVNSFTDGQQGSPSLTALSDGGFIVTWDTHGLDGSSLGVFAQRYDADGVRSGDEFLVNTATVGETVPNFVPDAFC